MKTKDNTINENPQFVGTGQTNNRIKVVQPENRNEQIQGLLTSRIETKKDQLSRQFYYYGFFKLPDQEQEIPVVFKTKPAIPKGSQVQLTGH